MPTIQSSLMASRSLPQHASAPRDLWHLGQARHPSICRPQQNRLLDALDADVQARLFPHLDLINLPLGKVLYESGDVMPQVYFPVDAIVSLLYMMEDGASTQVSMVGNEGLLGVALFMGDGRTCNRAVVQSAGLAYRLPGAWLKDEFHRHGHLLELLLRYTQGLITQMAQTAVCNRHHTLDQRLCRWLLLSLDRLPDNRLTMTQELISNLLGVRREGVTEAAGKLQALGVLKYRRGQITVLDRPRLEQMTCECYGVVKKETDRLCPAPGGATSAPSRLPRRVERPRPQLALAATGPSRSAGSA